jgi:hypothetical protein
MAAKRTPNKNIQREFDMKRNVTKLAGVLAIAVLAVNIANASTIDFGSGSGDDPYVEDGFSFNPSRLVNGNCDPDKPCLALNDNETTVMTFAGGAFTLQSVHFTLLGTGTGNTLTIFETGDVSNKVIFSTPPLDHNTYYTEAFGSQFAGVTSITFATYEGGNVRLDNLEAVAAVPLPAAGWLLGSGLLGLAGLCRKRKTA